MLIRTGSAGGGDGRGIVGRPPGHSPISTGRAHYIRNPSRGGRDGAARLGNALTRGRNLRCTTCPCEAAPVAPTHTPLYHQRSWVDVDTLMPCVSTPLRYNTSLVLLLAQCANTF